MPDDPPNVLLLFVLGVVTDCVYVATVRAIARKHVFSAALGNSALAAIGLGSTWAVIDHKSLLGAGAYILGCFLGTVFTLRNKR